ncbi:type II toxin-antitoxin system VapC family toxin [Archaeoglobus sp.]
MKAFFDSNIFFHHLADTSQKATGLLERVESGEIVGYINDVVVSEVIYGYLRATTDLRPYKLRKEILKVNFDLSLVKELLDMFNVLPCNIGAGVVEIIEKYRLLPNDALIAATCKQYGIKKIATFDDDFKRVDFLEVVEV